jgi:predicted dithiol-disulfide oxidoreductase (DUF899 family)
VSRAPLAKLQAYKRRMGLDVSLGILVRQRLQLRLQHRLHRGAAAQGGIEYNYRREAVFEWRAGQEGGGEGAEASSRPCAEPTRPRTIATGRA